MTNEEEDSILMRLKVSHFLALVVVAALSVGLLAGPASAKTTRLSAKQKAAIRHKLMRQIKKNPKLFGRKSFMKKASLVDFVLPVTIKLRDSNSANNPNSANIDLGASLGQRTINLGGTLPAEIKFHDSFDGGALGNVDLTLLPGGNGGLTTTSIPLLWNTQVSQAGSHWYDAGGSPFGDANPGCGDFLNSAAVPNSLVPAANPIIPGSSSPGGPQAGAAGATGSTLQTPSSAGIPVYDPSYDPTNPTANIAGLVDEYPGVDSIDALTASPIPGSANNLGASPTPFPSGVADPGGFTQPPSLTDTVLRTGPITLRVANPGTQVNQSTAADGTGAQGSQNIAIGTSGGQANLFGNIPGKQYGIDVTVSLEGKINSILRQVDGDFAPLVHGQKWPAAAFQCRQAWTGAVQNYIPDVHLTGNLHISPAITSSGALRIAKASLSTQVLNGVEQTSRVALAACLTPYETFATMTSNSSVFVPDLSNPPTSFTPPDTYPINETTANSAPTSVNCNDPASQLVQDANVTQLTGGQAPYTTTNDGSQVSVAGDLSVNDVEADVLIGENQ